MSSEFYCLFGSEPHKPASEVEMIWLEKPIREDVLEWSPSPASVPWGRVELPAAKFVALLRKWHRNAQPQIPATLKQLLLSILELGADLPAEDDLGRNRPTDVSLRSALRFCIDSELLLAESLPEDPFVDRNGDIRLEWRVGAKSIELIFPGSEEEHPYLYYSSETDYGIDEGFDVPLIRARIAWLHQ